MSLASHFFLVCAPQMMWVAPATGIFYDSKRAPEPGEDTWLMAWKITDPDQPSWTIKTGRIPVPTMDDPRLASWEDPSEIVIARTIAHSLGYLALHGLPVRLGEGEDYTEPVSHDWIAPGTVIEVLGPPR